MHSPPVKAAPCNWRRRVTPEAPGGGIAGRGGGRMSHSNHVPDRLRGQVVIVTGGTKGIGRGIAERLALEGARVVITGRDRAAGEETVRAVEEMVAGGAPQPASGDRSPAEGGSATGGRAASDTPAGNRGAGDHPVSRGDCRHIVSDNADPANIRAVVDEVLGAYGRIDALVNNAATMERETLLSTEPEFLERVLRINLVGAAEFCRQVMPSMIERGDGHIVNIGSTHAWSGLEDLFAYSISKGALLTLTHHIARNYAGRGIRANWVTVGWVKTPGEIDVWARQGRDERWIERKAGEVVPMGRLQKPEEMGAAVAFLLSPDAGQITGTELDVTGGLRV